MTDDWQINDLAQCIRDDWGIHPPSIPMPKLKEILIVKIVLAAPTPCQSCGQTHPALGFVGYPPLTVYDAQYFRKIFPKGEDRRVPRREAVPV